MDEDFESYYALGLESDRLTEGTDSLELARTLELLEAVLPSPPADVLDVGGGPGVDALRSAAAAIASTWSTSSLITSSRRWRLQRRQTHRSRLRPETLVICASSRTRASTSCCCSGRFTT